MKPLSVLLVSVMTLFCVFACTKTVFAEDFPQGQQSAPLPSHMVFIPGAALYKDGKLVNVLLGKEEFSTMAECMADAAQTVRKNSKAVLEGNIVSGFCLPLHVYSQKDVDSDDAPEATT